MEHNEQVVSEPPQNTQNQSQQSPQSTPQSTKKSSTPLIVGSIIVIIALALGGLYVWGTTLKEMLNEEEKAGPSADEILGQPDQQREELEMMHSSDTATDIESDLDSTDLNDLDAEIDSIEAELQTEAGSDIQE